MFIDCKFWSVFSTPDTTSDSFSHSFIVQEKGYIMFQSPKGQIITILPPLADGNYENYEYKMLIWSESPTSLFQENYEESEYKSKKRETVHLK